MKLCVCVLSGNVEISLQQLSETIAAERRVTETVRIDTY